ncbi:MAG TPA: hypothetical protein VKB80_37215 [Kofleriaceae bacterium]|nr:hypothetical protein [Kofleriaceae bacterium]
MSVSVSVSVSISLSISLSMSGVDADDAAPAAVRQIGFLSLCHENIL